MSNSENKSNSFFEPKFVNKNVASFVSSANENDKEFYAINIPSLRIKSSTDQATTSSSANEILSSDKCIYFLPLTEWGCGLPPRLQGQTPILSQSGLVQQEKDWNSLIKDLHRSRTMGTTLGLANDMTLLWKRLFNKPNFAAYSLKVCATPGCRRPIPASKQSDHLNLCDEHSSELNTLLKNYQESYGIVIPQNMSTDDVHNMVYHNLLPNIDQLLQHLLPSTDRHTKYVAQVLLALKACIYLYRMHLNAMPYFIQTIVGLFLNALRQCETEMKQLVSALLKLVLVPFAICGIFLIWTADLLFSDDLHLSIILLAAGGGLAWWGYVTYAAAVVVLAGPIAAVAGGIALIGIGAAMFIKRLYRRAPHEYAVRAHINLNNVDGYLRQWLSNAF